MPRLEIKYGEKHGELAYIKDAPVRVLPSGQKPRRVICKCKCGELVDVLLLHWTRERITHCGCLGNWNDKNPIEGIYNSWRAMKNRCLPSYFQKQYYFDKGITVCKEWLVYKTFKKWALKNGWEEGLQLDRKKNNIGYCPENCRFVTQPVNLSNRDVSIKVLYNGEMVALALLIPTNGYTETEYNRVLSRIKRGWDAQRAIDTPCRIGNYRRKIASRPTKRNGF